MLQSSKRLNNIVLYLCAQYAYKNVNCRNCCFLLFDNSFRHKHVNCLQFWSTLIQDGRTSLLNKIYRISNCCPIFIEAYTENCYREYFLWTNPFNFCLKYDCLKLLYVSDVYSIQKLQRKHDPLFILILLSNNRIMHELKAINIKYERWQLILIKCYL